MFNAKIAFVLLAAANSSASFAQVYRCPDKATGKLTYSDAPCSDGKQIVRQLSDDERKLDAERASLSRQQKQLDQDRAAFQQEQVTQRQARSSQAPAPPAIDPIACQKAKRELSISSNLQAGTPSDKRRRMNAAILEVNASCGTKTELIQEPVNINVQPSGRTMTCQGSGGTMFCN